MRSPHAPCQACVANCSTCSSGTNCTQCKASTYLYNASCVTTCPSAYYGSGSGNTSRACQACNAKPFNNVGFFLVSQPTLSLTSSSYDLICFGPISVRLSQFLLVPSKTAAKLGRATCIRKTDWCREIGVWGWVGRLVAVGQGAGGGRDSFS